MGGITSPRAGACRDVGMKQVLREVALQAMLTLDLIQ